MVVRRISGPRGKSRAGNAVPLPLILGVLLLLVAWPVAWSGVQPWSWYTFVPLWLAYILIVDGIVQLRTGTSLLARSSREFALLFIASAPLWWIFELFNLRLDNWSYTIPFAYTRLEYVILGSIAFSTVVPAIFETADLYRSFNRPGRTWSSFRFLPGPRGWLWTTLLGVLMAAAVLIFPGQAFPLVWVSVFFICDPINRKLGLPSITRQTADGRWDTVHVLVLVGLTCGLFWEIWNFWSQPKWVYHVPGVGFANVFEMPILGYLGYIPFALEVYALYHLLGRLLGASGATYIRFDDNTCDDAKHVPSSGL
ncbi:MAG: hypothetical protein ACR2LS_04320 [Thermomicrobiales bacterium]